MTASVLYNRLIDVQKERLKNPFSVHTEVKIVPPALANLWLQENNYERQRPLRRRHVEYLAEEMRRGNFRQGTQIHFAEYDGKLHLVNGQHTLAAIAKSEISQILDICYTKEDPKDAYYRHDVGLKRTTADMFSALQVADEFGFTASQVNLVSSAVRFISDNFGNPDTNKNRTLHPDDHIKLFRDYADAAGSYFEIAAGHWRQIRTALIRAATASVALSLYKFVDNGTRSLVDEFWTGAIFDNGLVSGDPRKAAHAHLLSSNVKTTRSVGKNNMSSAKSARYLAQCWNAWADGREIQWTQVRNEKAPIEIRHTPYGDNQT